MRVFRHLVVEKHLFRLSHSGIDEQIHLLLNPYLKKKKQLKFPNQLSVTIMHSAFESKGYKVSHPSSLVGPNLTLALWAIMASAYWIRAWNWLFFVNVMIFSTVPNLENI